MARVWELTMISFSTARMHIIAMHGYLGTGSIKVLIFNVAFQITIQGIGIVCAKMRHIESICPLANLLIRGKADTDLAVRDLVCHNTFHCRHDFCNARLVVCAK